MPLNIIAEIGASHGKALHRSIILCTEAIKAGANWVKLQTYTPDTISHKDAGVCPDGPWKGRSLYELYDEAHMPRDLQGKLIECLNDRGVPWFSTPFSLEDLAWLEERGCPMYKLSSFDWDNEPLAEALRKTGKRVIASDGIGRPFADVILRCVSEYPAAPLDYGLGAFWPHQEWGVSDHTMTSTLGMVAIGKGATWIEKHIKLNGDTVTADSGFALDCTEFHGQCRDWHDAYAIATSTRRPEPKLKAIVPRPIEIDGKTVWRRG
jgi:sialic acid synthase SpsE